MTYLSRQPSMNFYTDLLEAVVVHAPAGLLQSGLEMRSIGDFARMVRRRRIATGLSQERLARQASVGRRFLIDLENEKSTIQAAELLRVCQAAGFKITIAVSERVCETPENSSRPEKGVS